MKSRIILLFYRGQNNDRNMGCADFEREWTEAMESLSTYSENPTEQNCENYKAALMDFYGQYEDCAFWGDEYQEAIDEIQEIDCSEETEDIET
ncbi:hypothetical protein [Salinimicrobium marinum]|nr:hypothetical protein [Salinimicrobium marinum]